MALFSFLGKSEVPDELPALASEELETSPETISKNLQLASKSLKEKEPLSKKYVFKKLPTQNNLSFGGQSSSGGQSIVLDQEKAISAVPSLSFFGNLQDMGP